MLNMFGPYSVLTHSVDNHRQVFLSTPKEECDAHPNTGRRRRRGTRGDDRQSAEFQISNGCIFYAQFFVYSIVFRVYIYTEISMTLQQLFSLTDKSKKFLIKMHRLFSVQYTYLYIYNTIRTNCSNVNISQHLCIGRPLNAPRQNERSHRMHMSSLP